MKIARFIKKLAAQGVELYPDGERLGCRAPEGFLTSEFIAQLQTKKQELLAYLSDSERYELSYTQKGIWFEQTLAPEKTHYHVSHMLRIYSVVDVALLQQTFQRLVNRHPVLRTTIIETDGQPQQRLHHYQEIAFTQVDASGWSWDTIQAQAQAYHEQPFDLEDRALRVFLFTKNSDEHLLLINMHHMFMDGWSLSMMYPELQELYLAAKHQRVSTLPILETTYADYVIWQQKLLDEQSNHLRTYWCNQLAGELPILNLPTDRPYLQNYTQPTARHAFEISTNIHQALRTLARQEGATLSTLLLAVYKTLLHRYSGQDDILVGSIMAGRSQAEFENVFGYFISPIVLLATFAENLTFQTFLQQLNQTMISGLNHQDYPLPLLTKDLELSRVPGRSPLYQAAFNMQIAQFDTPDESDHQPLVELKPAWDWDGLQLSSFIGFEDVDALDLTLHVTDFKDSLKCTFSYHPELFDPATIARMASHFQTLLTGIIDNPLQRVAQLLMLNEGERRQLLVEWNDTATDYPKDRCIHQLFEEQAERTPNAIAVVFEDQHLTYEELNARANQLAHYLQELGVGPETLVGVCVERSVEMIVGLLGILKAGGAYVPLDVNYPEERLAFMIEDTAISIVLTQEGLSSKFGQDITKICLDSSEKRLRVEPVENIQSKVMASDLAYIMYTSGSTGQAKGVCITQQNVVRLVQNTNFIQLSEDQIWLQLAPISFDASTLEIWGPLLNGGRLVVMPPQQPSLAELGHVIKQHQVTTLWLTAGLFHLMVDERLNDLRSLRQLLAGGDVLSTRHVQKFVAELPDCQLINGYGPTENTTFTCCFPIPKEYELSTTVPIGRPIANTQVYILDETLQPVPVGVTGTLYAGGDGIARGYHNRPQLTAERFVENPHGPIDNLGRLYNTGDLVRWLPGGNIEFLGRTDTQVKLRGFRIELGEIENALLAQEGVREAVVVARQENDDKRLVAYIVQSCNVAELQSEERDPATLRQALGQQLPNYMIPSAFVFLDAMPLTPNGKLDRRALPAPDYVERQSEFVAPRTEMEAEVATIWEEVLHIDSVGSEHDRRIGIYDNFFELGGHSLLATQVISRMNALLDIQLPLRNLFEYPTIDRLTQRINEFDVAQGLLTNNSQIIEMDEIGEL